jgi:hypothetical protein
MLISGMFCRHFFLHVSFDPGDLFFWLRPWWGQNFNEQKNGPTHHGAHWLTNHACRNYRTYEPFLSIFQRKQHAFRKGRGKVWVPCVVRKSLFRFFSFQEAKVHIIRLTTLTWLSFNKNSILVSRKKWVIFLPHSPLLRHERNSMLSLGPLYHANVVGVRRSQKTQTILIWEIDHRLEKKDK